MFEVCTALLSVGHYGTFHVSALCAPLTLTSDLDLKTGPWFMCDIGNPSVNFMLSRLFLLELVTGTDCLLNQLRKQ